MSFDDWYSELLDRRLPREAVVTGRAYVIYARNAGIGVAERDGERLGYKIRREKFERIYLFTERDWGEGSPHGTAIPLAEIQETPPTDESALLTWLLGQEHIHEADIEAARSSVLAAAKVEAAAKGQGR